MQSLPDARGRTKHVSKGRPIAPSEVIDCGSHRAQETHPFRPLAIQKSGVYAPVRHKLSGRVPWAITVIRSWLLHRSWPKAQSKRAGVEAFAQGCHGGSLSSKRSSHRAGLLLLQLGGRLLDTRPVLSSLRTSTRRRPPVCARDDRHSAPGVPPVRRALASCRSCVPCVPANSWPWADCE